MSQVQSHKIRKKFIHKGYIFLLSVYQGNGFWTTHHYEGGDRITIGECERLFQKPHDKQMEGLILESTKKREFEEISVTDITKQQGYNQEN